MFFPSDPFSEIVAHFLGYFQIAAEDMKVRLEMALAEHEAEAAPQAPEMQQISVDMLQSYALGNYAPGVFYAPPEFLIHGEATFGSSPIGLANTPDFTASELDQLPSPLPARSGDLTIPLIGIEPGSVIAVFSQAITLYDNDIFIMGTPDEPLTFRSDADTGLLALQAASNDVLGPIATGPGISRYDDVPLVLDAVGATAKLHQSNPGTQFEQVASLTGTYVNGKLEEDVPDLADALPKHLQEEIEDAPESRTIEVTGEQEAHIQIESDNSQGSVTYNSGGNFLVNEAAVLNGGLVGTHFVVGGNFHQLDAIIQTNAFSDIDYVNDDLPLSTKAGGATNAVNVASFVQETFDAAGANAEANPGVMPQNWQVTCVSGDVIFLEWMKQLTFMSDQDMGVLTASGSDAVVTSGENIAFNGVNFANIGLLFDLILVGGNVYDANVIVQNNILYDNDTVTMLGAGDDGDYPASGELNTSGNLLWNQAVIHNVGATEVKSGISDHYKDAMEGLAGGNKSMPASFYSAEDFEGIAIPRVLYISGSLYDLRYIEQTNILGDSDFVALQKKAFLDGQPVTEWNIDTGSNALVNIAAIKDYDTYGDTIEVGGNHYSDSILIQANILQAQGDGSDDDALVSEVVAFLDHTDTLADTPDYALGGTTHDAAPVDLMQSVLA